MSAEMFVDEINQQLSLNIEKCCRTVGVACKSSKRVTKMLTGTE